MRPKRGGKEVLVLGRNNAKVQEWFIEMNLPPDQDGHFEVQKLVSSGWKMRWVQEILPDWEAGKRYGMQEKVKHKGQRYISRNAHTSNQEPGSENGNWNIY